MLQVYFNIESVMGLLFKSLTKCQVGKMAKHQQVSLTIFSMNASFVSLFPNDVLSLNPILMTCLLYGKNCLT